MLRPTGISTVGDLRRAIADGSVPRRNVHQEVRENLITKLRSGEPLFPGIVGYDDTVVPQLVNALLSQHNFILLGLRGQAKTRLLRALMTLLDDEIPVMPGCEINDDPLEPICSACRARLASEGDKTPIAWLERDARYVEKLATPDVTIADMVGDIDPIKAARAGLQLSSELTMHYGLLPRANRGIFAINELPDLAGKIQVGLFNILQEGDVQIKGYPVRLPLDVMMAFTANPEDYTARGKIITPLKDRIGSEIRTHYRWGAAMRWRSPRRKRGPSAMASVRERRCPRSLPKSSRKLRFRRVRTGASTSDPASASGFRFRQWKMSSRTPSGGR
jgi:magnesium chelatase subunit I